MDKDRWVTNFNCRCVGTGFVVVWRGEKSQEAKCPDCDQWRHQEKADRIRSLKDMEFKGWILRE